MKLKIFFCSVISVLLFQGCVPLWDSKNNSRWEVEERKFTGKRAMDVVDEMPRISPYSRYYQRPVVQKVKVPAMVRNGVYIPEHYEYVIVRPGEYVLEGSPASRDDNTDRGAYSRVERENRETVKTKESISISEIKEKYRIPDNIKPVIDAKGDYDCLVIPYATGVDWTGDIVPVNLSKIEEYLNEKSIKTPHIVSNDQPVSVEKSNYTFTCSSNRTWVTVQNHTDGRTVSIRVPSGGGLLIRNGDVFKVICL